MNNSRKFLAWVLVVLMTFALLAGGCGGSDSDSGGSSDTPSEEVAQDDGGSTEEEDGTGRNAKGVEVSEFMRISGQWRVKFSYMNTHYTDNYGQTTHKSYSVDPSSYSPGAFRIWITDNGNNGGVLAFASYSAVPNSNSMALSFLPVTAEFYDKEATGDMGTYDNEDTYNLLDAVMFEYVDGERYEGVTDDGDRYIIDIDNSTKLTVTHIGEMADGTEYAIYTTLEADSLDYVKVKKKTGWWGW